MQATVAREIQHPHPDKPDSQGKKDKPRSRSDQPKGKQRSGALDQAHRTTPRYHATSRCRPPRSSTAG